MLRNKSWAVLKPKNEKNKKAEFATRIDPDEGLKHNELELRSIL